MYFRVWNLSLNRNIRRVFFSTSGRAANWPAKWYEVYMRTELICSFPIMTSVIAEWNSSVGTELEATWPAWLIPPPSTSVFSGITLPTGNKSKEGRGMLSCGFFFYYWPPTSAYCCCDLAANLNFILKQMFMGISFKKYIPCNFFSRGNGIESHVFRRKVSSDWVAALLTINTKFI